MTSVAAFLFWSGCVDYSLKTPPAPQALRIEPESVSLGTVCAASQTAVVFHNDGEEPLRIENLEVLGEGWTMAEAELPIEVAMGESWELALDTEGGEGQLIIESNDPKQAASEVALSATLNQPPTVSILNPTAGDALGLDPVLFQAQVADDADPVGFLLLQWRSNQDGVFGIDPADADGLATEDWRPYHTPGPHNIQLMVTDSCMESGTDVVQICQQGGYTTDLLSSNDIVYSGAAAEGASRSEHLLTQGEGSSGSVFFEDDAIDSSHLKIDFSASLADDGGIALVVQDASSLQRLGDGGACLGYATGTHCPSTHGAMMGWALEIDPNPSIPIDGSLAPRVALIEDGMQEYPIAWAELSALSGPHLFRVSMSEGHFSVIVDETLVIDIEIEPIEITSAILGFTASTESVAGTHAVSDVFVEELVCD